MAIVSLASAVIKGASNFVFLPIYREYFNSADQLHGSALHGDQCAACRKAHTNFANESACLMADNV
jgi:hypothetical protein